MDFHHSVIVATDPYGTDGLCDGIELRINKDEKGEILGAINCQKHWSKLVGPIRNYKGTLGSPFSFVRVAIPGTLPGRLEVVSYANEFAFIYDDEFMEDLNPNLESETRQQILSDFGSNHTIFVSSVENAKSEGATLKSGGVKQIQSSILSKMIAIDKDRGITTMKSWQKFIQVVANRQRSEPFSGLEEYLPYRISDAGELFWFGLVTFAMGLTIPEEEMSLCKQLSRPTWKVLVLTNDLYSWEKERAAAAEAGAPHVVNAIWVLMREHAISEAQAKDLCREKIKQHVVDAMRLVDATKRNTSLSRDLRVYTEAILYSISGNLVWSLYCPRYNPGESYDTAILSMMAEVDKVL